MKLDVISAQDWRCLLEERSEIRVSILMPTHRAGAATQQDPTRLKNLLRQAEARLLELGISAGEAAALLTPAARLLTDPTFWRHQGDGLAIFLASGWQRVYRLPLRFKQRVTAGYHFAVKPLAPLLATDGRFYVLALSLHAVRLLEATRDGVRRLDLAGVPASFDEALGYQQYDSSLQAHSVSSPHQGRTAAAFHGHGDSDEERFKDDVARYFHLVAKALDGRLERGVPLVLAAVDSHFPLWRTAADLPELLEEGIPGNPEHLSDLELKQRAWQLVEPHFLRARDQALARYEELKGFGRASHVLEEIVPAAHQGRVEALFVAVDPERWGRFDPTTGEVELHEEPLDGDEDLLDAAAFHTLAHRGAVFGLETAKVPDGSLAAAVLRY
ncbi:MAG: hypothetical protein HC897_19615 [Thermoanaerobaculia bacterium]|nr:hypothetical protein [Thermoanaerobaculia bacterium]